MDKKIHREMLVKMENDISSFHEKFLLHPFKDMVSFPPSLISFRSKFIIEEATETTLALRKKDHPGALDGLIDLAYVALGTLYLCSSSTKIFSEPESLSVLGLMRLDNGYEIRPGDEDFIAGIVVGCRQIAISLDFHFDKGWDRVQHANMQKVRAQKVTDGKRGSTWDVVKPTGWEAPIMDDLV